MDDFYGNKLKQYMTDPSSYSGSPGFQFALQTGLDGMSRKLAAGGFSGSGNALAELTKYGTGLASQDYGATLDRLGKLQGQEQNYDLGLGQNANQATANSNTAQRNAWDYELGGQKNANDAQNNFWNYNVNQQQNANTAARNQNDFALGNGRNAIDWFNAGTNRGTAQSNAFNNSSNNQLDWAKYYNPQPWRVG